MRWDGQRESEMGTGAPIDDYKEAGVMVGDSLARAHPR